MKPRKYQFNNSYLTIIFGDIMSSQADVIVSSDDTELSMGGGVSWCIRKKGGEAIRNDARKKLPANIGDVIVSTAGTLQYQKYIFHCLTISYNNSHYLEEKTTNGVDMQTYILQHSIDKCFTLLHALDINSIAFPCIGAGTAHFPIERVAEVMADAISSNLAKTQKQFNIELYLYDKNHCLNEIDYIDIFEHFAIKSALAKQQVDIDMKLLSTEECSPIINSDYIPFRMDMNHDVFISYSRKDCDKIEVVKQILDENNIAYWIDKQGIYSGENYKEVIVDAIDCAKVVLFASSINSNSSINVVRELGYAVKQKKRIIPILLDDAQYAKSIRLDIADIDQIEFQDQTLGMEKLISSIAFALQIK